MGAGRGGSVEVLAKDINPGRAQTWPLYKISVSQIWLVFLDFLIYLLVRGFE